MERILKNISRVIKKQQREANINETTCCTELYIELHNYKSVHTFHQMSSHHFTFLRFTSHHFTALHYTSRPIFHYPPLLDVSSPPFKNPSHLLTYNYLHNPLSKNI